MYSQLKAILVFLFCLLISSTWNKSLTFHKLFFLLGQSLEAVRLEQLHQFYTLIFTKHPHQFIYSTHLFNKIFILLPFFIILSLAAFLSQTQSESTETQTHLPQNNSFSLTDPNHHHTNLKILPQNNFLSLTEPNHHHTNLKILASTKHSFITTFIASSSPRHFSGFRRLILLCCGCEGWSAKHSFIALSCRFSGSDQNLRILTATKKISEKVMKLRIGGSEGMVWPAAMEAWFDRQQWWEWEQMRKRGREVRWEQRQWESSVRVRVKAETRERKKTNKILNA